MSDTEPRLPVLVNINTEERHTLADASITLGRSPAAKIILSDDGYASAEHARIFWDEGAWWVEDLGSSNGTAVNDQPVDGAVALAPGDTIKVGRTFFRIE